MSETFVCFVSDQNIMFEQKARVATITTQQCRDMVKEKHAGVRTNTNPQAAMKTRKEKKSSKGSVTHKHTHTHKHRSKNLGTWRSRRLQQAKCTMRYIRQMFQALSTSDSVCLSLKCAAAEKAFEQVPPTSTKYDYASHSTSNGNQISHQEDWARHGRPESQGHTHAAESTWHFWNVPSKYSPPASQRTPCEKKRQRQHNLPLEAAHFALVMRCREKEHKYMVPLDSVCLRNTQVNIWQHTR